MEGWQALRPIAKHRYFRRKISPPAKLKMKLGREYKLFPMCEISLLKSDAPVGRLAGLGSLAKQRVANPAPKVALGQCQSNFGAISEKRTLTALT
jgi:hypothetical protein